MRVDRPFDNACTWCSVVLVALFAFLIIFLVLHADWTVAAVIELERYVSFHMMKVWNHEDAVDGYKLQLVIRRNRLEFKLVTVTIAATEEANDKGPPLHFRGTVAIVSGEAVSEGSDQFCRC